MDQINQENELQKAIDDITKNGGGEEANGDLAAGLEEQIQNQMGTPPVPPMPPAGEGPAEAMPPVEGGDGNVDNGGGADVADVPVDVNGVDNADGNAVDNAVDNAIGADGGEASGVSDIPNAADVANANAAGVADGGAGNAGAVEGIAVETAEVANGGGAAVAESVAVNVPEGQAGELNDMGGNDINSVKEAMLRDLFPIMDKVDMGAEEKFELYRTMLDSSGDKSLIGEAYEVVRGIGDEGARAEALLFLIKKADA